MSRWYPYADLRALGMTSVVITSFKNDHMTAQAVQDCLREPVRVVVVDNSGDYKPVSSERVLRPSSNLGWLRGNNYALRILMEEQTWDRAVLLNNDVRLSDGFFAGIIWAETATKAAIVASSYDDLNEQQRPDCLVPGEFLEPDGYVPSPVNIPTGACDGTAISVRRDVFETLGLLDETQFGENGWGGAEDLCYRVREAGRATVITRAAFVHHIGGGHQTAKTLFGMNYIAQAQKEGRSGMATKWGEDWRALRHIPTQSEVDILLEQLRSKRACNSNL